jgi:hypothetical protein
MERRLIDTRVDASGDDACGDEDRMRRKAPAWSV